MLTIVLTHLYFNCLLIDNLINQPLKLNFICFPTVNSNLKLNCHTNSLWFDNLKPGDICALADWPTSFWRRCRGIVCGFWFKFLVCGFIFCFYLCLELGLLIFLYLSVTLSGSSRERHRHGWPYDVGGDASPYRGKNSRGNHPPIMWTRSWECQPVSSGTHFGYHELWLSREHCLFRGSGKL